jgi:hypothetical protein
MTKFDKLYAASKEVLDAAKKPFIRNKVDRALSGAADSYETLKIDAQEKIDALTLSLVNGKIETIRELISARLDLAELDAQEKEAVAIKAELAADVPEATA